MKKTDMQYQAEAIGIMKVYASLIGRNEDLQRERLDTLTNNLPELEEVLKKADKEENKKDIFLIAKMLNTPNSPSIEERRKQLLNEVLEESKQGKTVMNDILLTPTEYFEVGQQIMDFFSDYSPYDFNMSLDGMFDMSGEPTEFFEVSMQNSSDEITNLLRELHAISNLNEEVSITEKEDARELIDTLRKFINDPVPDDVVYVEAQPGELAKIKTISNSSDAFKNYHDRQFAEKYCGNGIYVGYDTQGVESNLSRNRVLYDEKGERRGVARGTCVFYAKDKRGNYVNLNEAQLKHVMTMYSKPSYSLNNETSQEAINKIVHDDKRANELIINVITHIGVDQSGVTTLRNIGFTDEEIKRGLKFKKKELLDEKHQNKLAEIKQA